MSDLFATVRYLSKTWTNMKQRCENPNNTSYKYYGQRGIKICDRWQIRELFVADNIDSFPGLGLGYSIERINVDGDYCPDNCKWATKVEQARNKTNTTKITFRGKNYSAVATLAEELARELQIDAKTIAARIYNYDEESHGPDFEAHVLKPVEVSSKRIPVQIDGRNFPSKNQAAQSISAPRTTVTQRMQRYDVDFDTASKMSHRERWVSPTASPIVYQGVTYPTHRALAQKLGIEAPTITRRIAHYDESKHGDFDKYISAPLQVVSGHPTLFGQTFESNAAAARHFNIPTNTLANWLYHKTQSEVEAEIKNYGKAKKGVRSEIIFMGVKHNQSSLAKVLGIQQANVSRYYRTLSPEQFQEKIQEIYDSRVDK
jgi:hypothetical protein